ncbi:DUF2780 domain-containing protein [Shewanella sp. A25]|nr:DUF2780 domain-containing protein [Shewanella shenzhenensis]
MKAKFSLSLLLSAGLFVSSAHAGWLDNLAATQTKASATTTTATATVTESNELVGSVMSQLGLSQTQAEGGLGSLLGMAQTSLNTSDYATLAASIPNADSLLAAAPQLDSTSGVSGLLSKAGNVSTSLQGSALVLNAFQKLGISQELAVPMINVAKTYLETNGSEGSAALLTQGLGALL